MYGCGVRAYPSACLVLKKVEKNEHNIEYVDSVKHLSPIIDNVQVKTTCDTLKTDTNSLNNERLKKSPNSVCNQ